jgi:aspartate aminotransferase
VKARGLAVSTTQSTVSRRRATQDPILGLTQAFLADKNPAKMNLGVGAYRDDAGKPYVLACIREAERRLLANNADHEYSGIDGVPAFRDAALQLAFSQSPEPLRSKRVAAAQAISGTGALRIAGDFLGRFGARAANGQLDIYVPTPTWGNHIPIFTDAGLTVKYYRYYNAQNCGLDTAGMLADLDKAPSGSVVLLHACAHNPTGVDPTPDEWKQVSKLAKSKGHYIVLDLAYQGFASGDPERDAVALNQLVADGHSFMLCQSFAKNFGLYGERAGMWSAVCKSEEERDRVLSQMKKLIRPMYSNPPVYGARLVATVLGDAALAKQWRAEVADMAGRIIKMRTALKANLKDAGSKRDWSHVTKQIGMFAFSGLTPEQVDKLRTENSIYMTRDGRISMAGVTSGNVKTLATAIHNVTK